MEFTVLVINKDKNNPLMIENNQLIEAYLGMSGHEYVVIESVNEVTSEQYRQWDCVLAHVPAKELKTLEKLSLENPTTGLVLTTGGGVGEEHQKVTLINSSKWHFLPKPFTMRTFNDAIKRVVLEAKTSV